MKKIVLSIIAFSALALPSLASSQTEPHLQIQDSLPAKTVKIALTFDADMTDGMLARLKSGQEKSLYNKEIIEILCQEKAPATFFITGLWAQAYPEAVKDIASDSLFEIGNHSYDHRGFTSGCYGLGTIKNKDKAGDIEKAQAILTELTGSTPRFFRFPGGCHGQADLEIAKKIGLTVIGWDLASGDAFNPNSAGIVKNVLNNAKDGSIIVFHLSGGRYAPKTAEALKAIIPALKAKGVKFVKISDLGN